MGAALLGPVGGLLRLPGSTKLTSGQESRMSYYHTIGGRVLAHQGPATKRQWEVSVGSVSPETYQTLRQLASGVLGAGTYYWYDEFAQVTNILSPAASHLEPGSYVGGMQGGAGVTDDGVNYLRSVVTEIEPVRLADPIPVPHGDSVVVSAYVTASHHDQAVMEIEELDPENTVVTTHRITTDDHATGVRIVATFRSSLRTVSLRISWHSVLMVAMPAVTLTNHIQPWANGRGCDSALVDLHTEEVTLALDNEIPWGRIAGYSMTVTEIG